MGVPALLLARKESLTGTTITIRGPHYKRQLMVGDLNDGTGWAQREDSQPRLIFDRLELNTKSLKLNPGVIISVEAGEAYRIATSNPHDDEWIIAEVEPLDGADAAGLPLPEAA
jgi:hypothetical protein